MSAEVAQLVLSLADNKQLLGMRYAEWSSSAPTLEADIAAAAMGLDDIGHARVLYGCLSELGEDPRGSDRDTDPASYCNVAFLDDSWTSWDQFVAANAILDRAFTLVIEALVDGEVEVLRSRLRKMLNEEKFHQLHGRSWLKEGTDARVALEAEKEAVTFFGPDDKTLPGTRVTGGELRNRLGAGRLYAIGWENWDPARRRVKPGHIDEHTFDMLTGLLEKRYLLAGRADAKAGSGD
jgi:1,2-phenylacetyl-CoA epoxidase catalytic subunit